MLAQLLGYAKPNDTVSYSYNNARQRSQLVIAQPTGNAWTNTYAYDAAHRLTNVTSPAGGFTNFYKVGQSVSPASLIGRLSLPGGVYITNTFDANGRVTDTTLYTSNAATVLNRHGYIYNVANQRINLSRTNSANSAWAGYSTNTYDAAGELRTIRAYDSGNTNVPSLNFDYGYDAAWNMAKRTNNATVTSYTLNNLNQVTSDGSSFGYDSNGNRTSGPGSPAAVTYEYDDENQLTAVYVPGYWKQSYTYDGRQRVRVRSDYTWINGWYPNGEVRYLYDGLEIVQERTSANNPSVTYTRGVDLSGSLKEAGGIGGLLARSEHTTSSPYQLLTTGNYHSDGNGNITALADSSATLLANYKYNPYGGTLNSSGTKASANLMRFSSKPLWVANAGGGGLYYYGYRFYDPSVQRWLSRDPINELGGINLYGMASNNPLGRYDKSGLMPQLVVGMGAGCAAGAVGSLIGSWISGDDGKTAACKAGFSCAAGAVMGGIATMVPWASGCLVGAGQAMADGLGGAFCDRQCSDSPRKPNTCYAVGAAAAAITGCIMGRIPANGIGGEVIKTIIETLYSSLAGTLGTDGCDLSNNFLGPKIKW